MAVCSACGREVSRLTLVQGKCGDCFNREYYAREDAKREAQNLKHAAEAETASAAAQIVLTTESAPGLSIARRLDIVTAEVVIGLHLFKDVAAVFRDAFGGRSKTMQDGLREARKTALAELRREAHALGADAVVGVDLDYSEISGGGKSMLFLVASGTAVTLAGGPDRT